MAPIPTMSMETLASCAETGQSGAATISTANNIRFIMRQIDAWREGRQSPKKIQTEILPKAAFPMLHRSPVTGACQMGTDGCLDFDRYCWLAQSRIATASAETFVCQAAIGPLPAFLRAAMTAGGAGSSMLTPLERIRW
jgi:hypothetical protein